MNRLATSSHRRKSALNIVAKRDLLNEGQRRLHDLIHRMHMGRWPTLRALAMIQIGGVLCEAVEWAGVVRPSYSVVRWQSDGLGLSWKDVASAQEARAVLTSMSAPFVPISPPRPSDRAPSARLR